jgi:putative exporter of polyketide antibiotics
MPAARSADLTRVIAAERSRLEARDAPATATDGATVTFDLSASNYHKVTLGGNRTLAVSGARVGQVFRVQLIQDGTGSRTVTWWAGLAWPSATAPTLTTTAAKYDVFEFVCTAANVYVGRTYGLNYT